MSGPDRNILKEAAEAVYGDREKDYGHPYDMAYRVAELWRAYFGWDVTVTDVAAAMVLMKLARERHRPKADNRVDGAGYFAVWDRIVLREEEAMAVALGTVGCLEPGDHDKVLTLIGLGHEKRECGCIVVKEGGEGTSL